MYRSATSDLEEWRGRSRRKPLVIRGARQVGKTTLVRLFAKQSFETLTEFNFERDPHLASLFESNDPKKIRQVLMCRLASHSNLHGPDGRDSAKLHLGAWEKRARGAFGGLDRLATDGQSANTAVCGAPGGFVVVEDCRFAWHLIGLGPN